MRHPSECGAAVGDAADGVVNVRAESYSGEGSRGGLVRAIAVTLTGIFTTVLAVTGIIMWLRKRSDRKEPAGKGANPHLRPAE
jgi:uncharacterized iron-regulated membrane protein